MIPNWKTLSEGTPQSFQEEWAAAKKDINTEVFHAKGNFPILFHFTIINYFYVFMLFDLKWCVGEHRSNCI